MKNGEVRYERDSITYDTIQYSWPVLSFLLYIINNENRLNVIDYGGSLGTSYFQNLKFLNQVDNFRWNIIEQEAFVKIGKEYFSNENLFFYPSIDECLQSTTPSILLFSSSLQYLERPFHILDKIIEKSKVRYMIFDLIGILNNGYQDRLTVQKVSPKIYDASYPCWFFNEQKIHPISLNYGYEVEESFHCGMKKTIQIDYEDQAGYKGYFFKRITNSKYYNENKNKF